MRAALFSLIALASPCFSQSADRQNWFHDPFFQVSSDVPGCPVPAGPFITDQEKRVQAHHRAERGTTCWLSGQCDKPNFYAYDAEIAEALKAALLGKKALAGSSLWVTVQGRVVFIEGCVHNESAAPEIEAMAREVANVQQAVALVYDGSSQKPPYKLLNSTALPK